MVFAGRTGSGPSHKKSQDIHRSVESGPVGEGRVGQLGPNRSGCLEHTASQEKMTLSILPTGGCTKSYSFLTKNGNPETDKRKPSPVCYRLGRVSLVGFRVAILFAKCNKFL